MDLGCIDLGCIISDKNQSETTSSKSDTKELDTNEKVNSASKIGKNKSPRGSGQTSLNALNKFTSQIKKPTHRKTSPLNWFPRKKMDSYLKRKIKMLQEVDGMNLTLDETLGDSNLHYTRVLREKIAAREAARTAMDARKAALIEGSWCRILQAARIQCREEEALLIEAEKAAAEAFEAATAMGVVMYDKPNCPQKSCCAETARDNRGRSSSHSVTASFETAFEVDKKVAAAVKTAFIRLANCPDFDRDECKDLLRKISENPDTDDTNKAVLEFSSGCESESGSEHEKLSHTDRFIAQDVDCKLPILETRLRKMKRRQSMEKFNVENLVNIMLERLRRLKDDELSSLATIVATCGLNAALSEVESCKLPTSIANDASSQALNIPRRISSVGAGVDGYLRKKQSSADLPSLDKFLVKHMTKLEREVQEAKSRRKNELAENNMESSDMTKDLLHNNKSSTNLVPDLGSILVKHSSKFEREIEEARKNSSKDFEINTKKVSPSTQDNKSDLGSIFIKHSSKLEKEVQELRANAVEKENMNLNLNLKEDRKKKRIDEHQLMMKDDNNKTEESLDTILVKPVHRLEKEKMQASAYASRYEYVKHRSKHGDNAVADGEGLDKVLIKHVSRLEKEKMNYISNEESSKKRSRKMHMQVNEEGGLDQILVKHKSRLEKEKEKLRLAYTQQSEEERQNFVSRREARERELQEAWGGLSLGNSIKPHVSKLERDKAAWIKAEEEERRRAIQS